MNRKWIESFVGVALVALGLAMKFYVTGEVGAFGVVPVLLGTVVIALAVTRKS